MCAFPCACVFNFCVERNRERESLVYCEMSIPHPYVHQNLNIMNPAEKDGKHIKSQMKCNAQSWWKTYFIIYGSMNIVWMWEDVWVWFEHAKQIILLLMLFAVNKSILFQQFPSNILLPFSRTRKFMIFFYHVKMCAEIAFHGAIFWLDDEYNDILSFVIHFPTLFIEMINSRCLKPNEN